MSQKDKRRAVAMAVDIAVMLVLWLAGAGAWALLCAPHAVWCFYDGRTRNELCD